MPNSSLALLVVKAHTERPTLLAIRARSGIREVERFAYRAVSDADNETDLVEAQTLMRLTVGLRRKLDAWDGDVP